MKEYEIRCLIEDKDKDRIVNLISDRCGHLGVERRFTLVHVGRADFVPDPSRVRDIKIRTDGRTARLTVKLGSWHDAVGRSEFEIELPAEQFGNAAKVLTALGYNYFVQMYTTRHQGADGLVEYSLDVISPSEVNVLEIELRQPLDDEEEALRSLNSVAESLAVVPLTSEGTVAYVSRINADKASQLDFERVSVDEWLAQSIDMIKCRK